MEKSYLLAINGGSSSLKFGLYASEDLSEELTGHIQKIGSAEGQFDIHGSDGQLLLSIQRTYPDNEAATRELINWLKDQSGRYPIALIGHRLVQGGEWHKGPELITAALLQSLEKLINLAPNHLPAELSTIKAFGDAFEKASQVACFDTAFHRGMPWYAQYYPISQSLREEGLIRYGFHGLSYEYIVQELVNVDNKRIIIAHLGNGCSMAATQSGKSIDTTMGLTPTGGLVMGTRSGDLDPGLLLFLLLQKKITPEDVEDMMTKHAGLEALSGGTSDVQMLLEKEAKDPMAAEALTIFCYQAKKFIGALSAALGGLDSLVFTGGIGENAPSIRRRICEGLQFLGIQIEPALNESGQKTISAASGQVKVQVIRTNEELMIARHTQKYLRQINT